jgi:hypothetical protein
VGFLRLSQRPRPRPASTVEKDISWLWIPVNDLQRCLNVRESAQDLGRQGESLMNREPIALIKCVSDALAFAVDRHERDRVIDVRVVLRLQDPDDVGVLDLVKNRGSKWAAASRDQSSSTSFGRISGQRPSGQPAELRRHSRPSATGELRSSACRAARHVAALRSLHKRSGGREMSTSVQYFPRGWG